MQSFGDLFANNRLLALGLLLAALAVILAVGIGLFRLTFGRRLHMSGGRTRQPRLGVVDAFDLDRQRQLVIIRRDNVEHLLMIGGPNDVLVEAAIVRAGANVSLRDNGTAPSVGIPAPTVVSGNLPSPAAPPAGNGNSNGETPFPPSLPAVSPEPQIAPVPVERDRVAASIEPSQAPVPPVPVQPEPRLPSAPTLPAGSRPIPPRPTPTVIPPRPPVAPTPRPSTAPPPRPNFSRANPVPPTPAATPTPAAPRVEPVLSRPPAVQGATRDDAKGTPVPSMDVRNEDRGAPPPSPTPAATPLPSSSAAPPTNLPPRQALPARPASAAVPPRQPVVRTPASSAPPRTTVPSLGSLEEEMAKLLGRPMPPPDSPTGQ